MYDTLKKKMKMSHIGKQRLRLTLLPTPRSIQMGNMTHRTARALPEYRSWTIDTSNSELPSYLGSPQSMAPVRCERKKHQNKSAGPSRT